MATATDGRYGRVSTCSSCAAPIRWAVTTKGKRMPVDVEPSSRGNIVLVPRFRGEAATAHVYRDHTGALAEAGDAPTWTSHFASCPAATQHRRR